MLLIKDFNHKYINTTILKTLSHNRISTVLDFLEEDIDKLSIITKLSFPQIFTIRIDIINKYTAPLLNGIQLLAKSPKGKKFIDTGLSSLNNVLGGGIPIGFITEVCGLAESGKSQLCFQIAINCVKSTEYSVLYIDTKGDFSAVRIHKILASHGSSYQEMATIMYRIKIVNIWSMEDIIKLLNKIKTKSIVIENLILIIVDSLPCLMLQHNCDENKFGLKLLNIFVNHMRALAKGLGIGVTCVNIQTRWVDQDVDIEDPPQISSTNKELCYTEKRNRCLGNYWQHIPALVILLEKSLSSNSKEKYGNCEINITLFRSNYPNTLQKCSLMLTNSGISEHQILQ